MCKIVAKLRIFSQSSKKKSIFLSKKVNISVFFIKMTHQRGEITRKNVQYPVAAR